MVTNLDFKLKIVKRDDQFEKLIIFQWIILEYAIEKARTLNQTM